MALSADKPRRYGSGVDPLFTSLPCVSNVTIYEGSVVGESSTTGTYRATSQADTFVGFAHEQVVNPSGGTKRVKVRQKGIIRLTITGVSGNTDHGVAVYANDDDTFTLTQSSSAAQIGKVVQWITSTTADVYFEGAIVRSI
jgi:hypothetical protein